MAVPCVTDIHYIFYKPMSGGNFMNRLFSLSNNVRFLWKQGTCSCLPANTSLNEKLKYYRFSNPMMKENWLRHAHNTPYAMEMWTHMPYYWDSAKILITAMHFDWAEFCIFPGDERRINEQFFYIDVSDDLYKTLATNLQVSNRTVDAWEEREKRGFNKLNSSRKLTLISLDKMLTSTSEFLAEYKRVCSLMKISPVDDRTSVSFFNEWKALRFDTADVKLATMVPVAELKVTEQDTKLELNDSPKVVQNRKIVMK